MTALLLTAYIAVSVALVSTLGRDPAPARRLLPSAARRRRDARIRAAGYVFVAIPVALAIGVLLGRAMLAS